MKPRVASGYRPDQVELVRSLYLSVARILDDYTADLTVIGGYVPRLLIPQEDLRVGEAHVGTSDLDLVLEVSVLDEERYKEIVDLLRDADFEPATKPETGARQVQRWVAPGTDGKAVLEFLMPIPAQDKGKLKPGQVKNLEGDFGAMVLPGGELAFLDRIEVPVTGHTLRGAEDTRTMWVCGPAAFLVLKAFAHRHRDEPKDAYDLDYLVARYAGTPASIIERFELLGNSEHLSEAIAILRYAFGTLDRTGPKDVADFLEAPEDENLRQDVSARMLTLLEAYDTRYGTADQKDHP